jgi:hypothetical protein
MTFKHTILGLLASTAQAVNHRVLAAANNIDLDIRNNADYYGPLYVGEQYDENHLIYDTMADMTVVVADDAQGTSFPSNYDFSQSRTARGLYTDAKQLKADLGSLNLGRVAFTGQKYKD